MSTVQHEAIGRLLDIWLASLDWSKSGQSNAIVWTENVVSREHRNQQINHLSSINFFVRKTILKIWDWSPIYHYQRSLGHVWHDDEGQDDGEDKWSRSRENWMKDQKQELQARVCQDSSIRIGGEIFQKSFSFHREMAVLSLQPSIQTPPKGKKTKLKMIRIILKHSIV